MANIDGNTMVLVVSDRHLGASKGWKEEFRDFLKDVKDKVYDSGLNKLKALLILGDFFDLITDCYEDISNDFKEIYGFLDKLIEKGIHVITTPGNHEISIRKNCEKKFRKRKNKMIKKFRDKDLDNIFLNEENVCQYIILKTRKDDDEKLRWELVTYDSRKEFRIINNDRTKNLGKIPDDNPVSENYKCLLTHGFQFEPPETGWLLKLIWAILLKMPDFVKEIFNVLWNDIIKNVDEPPIKKVNKTTIKQRIKANKSKLKKLKRSQRYSYYLFRYLIIKELIKEEEHRAAIEDNRLFNKEIEFTFLPTVQDIGISHVIYGHSHTKQDTVTTTDGKIPLINSGGWQQVHDPTFVEIRINGDIIVKSLSAKTMEEPVSPPIE